MIPTWQVRAADAPPEKDISPDQKSLCFTVKADATRRMSRQEEDLQFIIPQGDPVPFRQKDQLSPVVLKRESPAQSRRRGILQNRPLFFVEMER
jgi:hypothetical protein